MGHNPSEINFDSKTHGLLEKLTSIISKFDETSTCISRVMIFLALAQLIAAGIQISIALK